MRNARNHIFDRSSAPLSAAALWILVAAAMLFVPVAAQAETAAALNEVGWRFIQEDMDPEHPTDPLIRIPIEFYVGYFEGPAPSVEEALAFVDFEVLDAMGQPLEGSLTMTNRALHWEGVQPFVANTQITVNAQLNNELMASEFFGFPYFADAMMSLNFRISDQAAAPLAILGFGATVNYEELDYCGVWYIPELNGTLEYTGEADAAYYHLDIEGAWAGCNAWAGAPSVVNILCSQPNVVSDTYCATVTVTSAFDGSSLTQEICAEAGTPPGSLVEPSCELEYENDLWEGDPDVMDPDSPGQDTGSPDMGSNPQRLDDGNDSGGCQIGTRSGGAPLWPLALALVGLVWVRRRAIQ